MEGLVLIFVITAVIGVFDLLASRYGADSRDIVIEAGRPARATGLTVR